MPIPTYALRRTLALLIFVFGCFKAVQARDPNTFSFYSWDRQRTYIVTSQEQFYSLQFPNHWTYEPSPLLAAPETGNLYMLVFASNLSAGSLNDQAIFVTSDVYHTLQFPAPTPVLRASQTTNICDMIDTRPIWDGIQWHVYLQAREWNAFGGCDGAASVFQAIGPDLYTLSWDVLPGTSTARRVLSSAGSSGVGIGEDQQWFYVPNAPQPFVATYNDWNNPNGGGVLLGAYGADGANMNPWYSANAAWTDLSSQGYDPVLTFPDALLSGSLDEGNFGPPGIGATGTCNSSGTFNEYTYSRTFAFFPNPMTAAPGNGVQNGGALRSIFNDQYGERMFTPRFARDSHGFIPLSSSSDTQRTWSTFVLYNPTQINEANQGCSQYGRWNSSDQEFAFSLVTITEQASIYLDPNPLPAGTNNTTVFWNLPGFSTIDIYIQSPGSNAQLFAEGGSSGSAPTGNWVSDGLLFIAVDKNSGVTLATATAHIQ